MFSTTESISITEKILNEDYYRVGNSWVWLMDGASGLTDTNITPLSSDARWFVEQIDASLEKHIGEDIDLLSIIQKTMEEVGHTFLQLPGASSCKKHEMPSATICVVRIKEGYLEYYGLGDSAILIQLTDGSVKEVCDTPLSQLEDMALQEMHRISEKKGITFREARPFIQDLLVEIRNKKNTEEGYFIFSVEGNNATKGWYGKIPLHTVDCICMLSDGFTQYYEDFHLVKNAEAFMKRVAVEGLEKLLKELQQEQRLDATCSQYKRLKKSDDTTGLYLQVRGGE